MKEHNATKACLKAATDAAYNAGLLKLSICQAARNAGEASCYAYYNIMGMNFSKLNVCNKESIEQSLDSYYAGLVA